MRITKVAAKEVFLLETPGAKAPRVSTENDDRKVSWINVCLLSLSRQCQMPEILSGRKFRKRHYKRKHA